MTCVKCGARDVGSKFCPECGAEQVRPEPVREADASESFGPTAAPGFIASASGVAIGLAAAALLTFAALHDSPEAIAKRDASEKAAEVREDRVSTNSEMERAVALQMPRRVAPECDGINHGKSKSADPCDIRFKGHRPKLTYRGVTCANPNPGEVSTTIRFTCRAFFSIHYDQADATSAYVSTFNAKWSKSQEFPDSFDIGTDLKNTGFTTSAVEPSKAEFLKAVSEDKNKSLRYNDPFEMPLSDAVIGLDIPVKPGATRAEY